MTAADIARNLHGRKLSSGWIARCPAHDDRKPSLSVSKNRDGQILVKCHAGCEQNAVINGLRARGLWNTPDESQPLPRRLVAEYSYTDERGELLYQTVRYDPKDFCQRHPDPHGGWIWKKHSRQVLYHLPEVLESPIIFVVEGERDCETLRDHGFVATTNAGGANAPWLPSYTLALAGREVILIPDADLPGRDRVLRITRSLLGHASKIVVFEPDGAKDITDWFDRGHSEVELIALIEGQGTSQ